MSDLVVITGATGNVGAEVLRNLASTPCSVRVAARDPAAFGPDVEAVPFAFEDEATYAPALDGAQTLFLMRPRTVVEVERHINPVVDAAVRAGLDRIVFLSVAGAAFNPHLPHRVIEQHIEQAGVGWTFLRANFFMQNFSTVHRLDISERDDVFVPAGAGKVAYIDVRDIAAIAARALTEPGCTGTAYEVTGPQSLDHAEVAQILTRVLGRRVTYSNPTPACFVEQLVRRGVPDPEATFVSQVYAVVREGHTARVTADVQIALGRLPTTFEQFAHDYRDCWRRDQPGAAP